jgi:hypothetical protein
MRKSNGHHRDTERNPGRHPLGRAAWLAALFAVATVLAACPSIPPPTKGQPWAYGQSGNQAGQSATSTTDLQFLCVSGSGKQVSNLLFDTAYPPGASDKWGYHATLPVPPSHGDPVGTHVVAIPEASPTLQNEMCTYDNNSCPFTGPLGLSAFWVDIFGNVWNSDQQGGNWGPVQFVGGNFQGTGDPSKPPSALRSPVGLAALQLDSTTQVAFWVAVDQSIWMNTRGTSGWGTPKQMAHPLSALGPIDALAESAQQVDVVWISARGEVFYASWDGNPADAFQENLVAYGASNNSGISEVLGGFETGTLNVFFVTTDGRLEQAVHYQDEISPFWGGFFDVAPQSPLDGSPGGPLGQPALDTGVAAVTTSTANLFGYPPHKPQGRIYVSWVDPSGVPWTACNDALGSCDGERTGTWSLNSQITGLYPASPNPLVMASSAPDRVDLMTVDMAGIVWDYSQTTSDAGNWIPLSLTEVPATCDVCGNAQQWTCNGACNPGTATQTPQCGEGNGTGGCNPFGGDGVCYACGDQCPSSSCTDDGTYLSENCPYSGGCCVCDSSIHAAPFTPDAFSLHIGHFLNPTSITGVDDELSINLPSLLTTTLNISAPPPFNIADQISKRLPSNVIAIVDTLEIPGDYVSPENPGTPWTWALDCNGLSITTTLSASITFIATEADIPCPGAVTITNAPLTMVLPIQDPSGSSPPQPLPGVFANAGAGLQLAYQQNTALSVCLLGQIFGPGNNEGPVEITGQVQEGIATALQKQLNDLLGSSPHALTQLVNFAANKGLLPGLAPADSSGYPTPQRHSWSCQAAPSCQPEIPINATTWPDANDVLVYCNDVCADNTPYAPFGGLPAGSPCFFPTQCASDICSSTTDTGSPPFVCTNVVCTPPCEVAGTDGNCHNSNDSGCNVALRSLSGVRPSIGRRVHR